MELEPVQRIQGARGSSTFFLARSVRLVVLCAALLQLPPSEGFRLAPLGSRARRVRSVTALPLTTDSNDKADASVALQYAPNDAIGGIRNDVKVGVLLLNLGGPETTQDVEGFLYNLFADPDIIRLPPVLSALQRPIAYLIAKRRAPKSTAAYQSIGGGSPIVKYTQAQASLIENALQKRGLRDAKCYFAMRYWNPYTEEVLEQMRRDGINTMVVVPLYPQYSISTSGSSLKLLQEIFYKNPDKWGPNKVTHTVVPAWYYRKGYVQAMASLILKEVAAYGVDDTKKAAGGLHVLFSAHGVPESYIEAGDPYQRQVEECVRLIGLEVSRQLADDVGLGRPAHFPRDVAVRLSGLHDEATGQGHGHAGVAADVVPIQFHLSFQSRVGPVEWLKPYTEETLEELGHSGVKNLIVVPVSFVSEHIETLEEIDMEYRELAEEHGITHWRRVPALNTDDGFIEDMADLVVEALESPAVSVAEAAAQNSDMLDGNRENKGPFGMVLNAEQLNGRVAMMGVMGTTAFELLAGHPVVQMVGLR